MIFVSVDLTWSLDLGGIEQTNFIEGCIQGLGSFKIIRVHLLELLSNLAYTSKVVLEIKLNSNNVFKNIHEIQPPLSSSCLFLFSRLSYKCQLALQKLYSKTVYILKEI